MRCAYWDQFSNSELMSMYGIQYHDDNDDGDDTDLCLNKDDTDLCLNDENQCGCAIGCMRCLGMSWKDFY